MIKVTCYRCGLELLVPETVQGGKGVCFGCGADLIVPAGRRPPPDTELLFARGARIGDRYEILDLIGRGGMAAVYRARDHLIGEDVALKFMNPRLLSTQRGQQSFVREAQMARRLRHDHIVAVHDVARTPEGILYLSMEYLRGQSLRAYLRARRQARKLVRVRLAVRLIDQILLALAYAHRLVIHRDLKPENVMLLPGEWAKVLDFGLAKVVDLGALDDEDAKKLGRLVGTAAYAAPEQKRRQDVDLRADLYSVGLVFEELLTLRTPVDDPVEVPEVRDDVSPALLAVLKKARAEVRENRWKNAGEFRRALREAYRESYESERTVELPGVSGRQVSTADMVYMEGGSFLMGSDVTPREAPEFEAYVEPFYIDRFPVTVRQYAEFLEATGHPKPKYWGDPHYCGNDQPVAGVTWADACVYAQWAGKTLPSEAQWEFAARGKENRLYPWGNAEPDSTRANYGYHFNMPSIVGMHEDGATPDGVHDLAGNVYEWTRDRYVRYSRLIEGADESAAEEKPPRCAVRGGCWQSRPEELRCSHRRGLFPEVQEPTVGFRCVAPVAPDAGTS